MSTTPWWREAVFYQIYIRSFADGNGDGVGDFGGMRDRLDHLSWLGVDAVWITPFFPSPGADHGYDVSNYRDVDPTFGTLDDFDAFLDEAHARSIRVILDLVPNHTSNEHPWFQNALSDRNHPDRDKYVFRDPKPDGSPPNNWESSFGGPAWTLHEPTGQCYLNLFSSEQPDLNWRNPEVHADFEKTLRFWLDRGADGFRIDVAHALYKDELLRDNPTDDSPVYHGFMYDQPEVHNVYRSWRRLADSYSGDRVLVGEVYLFDPEKVARYVREDELHLAFNFLLVWMTWDAAAFKDAIRRPLEALDQFGATAGWVLSNHDVERHVSRFGGGETGLRRGRAAALLLLSLPGAAFVYQGEELGLEQADVPDDRRQDPVFRRTWGILKGRDGCRVPIPWDYRPPNYGFSSVEPWLPAPGDWGSRSVEALREKPDSILRLYREALEIRRSSYALKTGRFRWIDVPSGCLGFERDAGERVICITNFTGETQRIAVEGSLLIASRPEVRLENGKLELPGDSSTWIHR